MVAGQPGRYYPKRKKTMKEYKGIFTALVTPFNSKNELNVKMLKKVIRFQLNSKIKGFFILGSTGEGLLMSPQERKKVAEIVVKEAGGEVPIIVHIGAIATQVSVELAKHAEKIGADAVSSIPPLYYKIGLDGIIEHYRIIGEAVNIPFFIYSIPMFAGMAISSSVINRLLAIPNLRGLKYSDYNLFELHNIIELSQEKLIILSGCDEVCLPALTMGAAGAVGLTYNFAPAIFIKLYEEFLRGNIEEARACQYKANRIIRILFKFGTINSAKQAMRLIGYDCGINRGPLLIWPKETKKKFEKEIKKAGLFDIQ
jgi:N-acetylneuraminate lyase